MYSKVLVATDLSPQTEKLLQRARHLVEGTDAELHLVHVVEPMSVSYGNALVVDFSSVQDQIFHQAETQLKDWGEKTGIPAERCYTLAGRTELVLCECVESTGAELLLLGGQTSSTLRTIFGSTGSGMLKVIPCDLMFVRLDA